MQNRKRLFSTCLSFVGAALLAYVAGAAAIFFQLPTSELLVKSMIGARAWYGARRDAPQSLAAGESPRTVSGAIDSPERTFDGFTLYACVGSEENKSYTQAYLINMRRDVVHNWSIPFSKVWPTPHHIPNRLEDSQVCFFACHLFPNGELLAVLHGWSSPMGCGLIKLDKDSNLLWAYPATMHHDVDIADDGSIYAIHHEVATSLPKSLDGIPTPCEIDYLHHISPDGTLLGEPISILEAFTDTPYAVLLEMLKWPIRRETPAAWATVVHDVEFMKHDPSHANSVKVLNRVLAPKFPFFQEGRVLISIRDMSVLAMLDPESGKIVWAARGPWSAQHDAQFLENGHLLLYDNLGAAFGSRVLEYDPLTQAFPWFYSGAPGAPFYSSERGLCQRLPNGNTLVVNSEGGEMAEVTIDKDVVWSSSVDSYITTARRYSQEQLPFLDGGRRARP